MKTDAVRLYLELMKNVLTNTIYEDPPLQVFGDAPGEATYDGNARQDGRDWPAVAHTMVGMRRLDNLQFCVESVLADGVPGDLIETGVWRGGASIFARAVLAAHEVTDRLVWVADSFQGMPSPTESSRPSDRHVNLSLSNDVLAVSLEEVRSNFAKYGLLDERVRFLPGWFGETLPAAPVERLAVLRLDGDMYESTMDGLVHLYPKLSPGGYVIVDDYLLLGCREAVEEFRGGNGITDPIKDIDGCAAYWRRGA
ncbi:TylF/MycF family methyltransferase [Amycolatopsis sp. NPDC059021]|uniref:TylF/MycF family methyltransferase n=1 Tax=Amycolatopsis sp. NPDC059021 TaxID=3346704 RepID=UPI00366DB7D0